jgi:hypothetical protein
MFTSKEIHMNASPHLVASLALAGITILAVAVSVARHAAAIQAMAL